MITDDTCPDCGELSDNCVCDRDAPERDDGEPFYSERERNAWADGAAADMVYGRS